ncbi:hypothetical protein, partial [Staphylococcus aureus]
MVRWMLLCCLYHQLFPALMLIRWLPLLHHNDEPLPLLAVLVAYLLLLCLSLLLHVLSLVY